MTHVGTSLERTGVAEPLAELDEDARAAREAKAVAVFRTLSEAGLKQRFEFEPDQAKKQWGVKLAPYPLAVLMEVCEFFIKETTEFPTVGEVETQARYIVNERQREERARGRAQLGPCERCDGARWVRVDNAHLTAVPDGKGGTIEYLGHHMEPCPECPDMAQRAALYPAGCMTDEHVDAGGCVNCRPYLHHCAPKRRGR